MELLLFIWVLVLSFVVAGQSSALRSASRSLDQVRAWIEAVVAQSKGGVAAPAAAPAPAAEATAPTPAAAGPGRFSDARGEEHGGRWLAIVGVLAVVAAAAFAVQYAIEMGWLTEGLRMVLGAIVGLGLTFLGNSLRARLGWFGDAVVGLGLAVLYLTAYSGYVFFDFYSYGFALAATVAVSVLAAVLAVSAKVEAPAALGAAGAFLTAIVLPMTASPAAVAFAFAAAAVSLAAATGAGWRATQAVAFAGSMVVFVEFLGWGYDQETQFWFVETFALLFIAVFTFAGYGWAALRRREPTRYDVALSVAATLVFAPIAIALADDYSVDYDGFLPLFLALAYGAAALWGYSAKASRLANDASLGLAAAFLATAVALQLDGAWVAILWAAEAALLALLAWRSSGEVFGALSGALAVLALLAAADVSIAADAAPVLNARFAALLAVLLAGWSLASAARVVSRRPGKESWRTGFALAAVLSHVLALGVSAGEINLAYQPKIEEAYDDYRSAQGGYSYRDGYGEYEEGNLGAAETARRELDRLESAQMTAVAIVWGLYGAAVLAIGFAVASAPSRYAGVGTLLLAAGDVFLIVWDLGTGYRVIASLAVGLLLLGGAYLFARYRHRIAG
jgi:uncharacterized membrane protein